MLQVEINGKRYEIVDSLGFNHSCGMYAKVVKTKKGEKVIVKHCGTWKFWGIKDRLGKKFAPNKPLNPTSLYSN